MSFREILDEWESRGGSPGYDKDAAGESDAGSGDRPSEASRVVRHDVVRNARRIAALEPEAVLDLHGMTAAEAEVALERFLADAGRRGLEKVLVIHGKGNHSQGEPVLGKMARRVIEASPWAGRYGIAGRAEGGSGALWVNLRRRES